MKIFSTGLNIYGSGRTEESLRILETSSKQSSCENLPASFPHFGLILFLRKQWLTLYLFIIILPKVQGTKRFLRATALIVLVCADPH